jgi:hypothetical protein
MFVFSRSNSERPDRSLSTRQWPEILKVEHPDRLRKAEFLKPVDVDDTFDAAAKQSSGPIAGRITTADRWGVGTGPA